MKLCKLPSQVITARMGIGGFDNNQYKTLDLSHPQIMGILNVTPDSFSDGGKFNKLDAALLHCDQMLQAGASIIDIGGESTRPKALTVSEDEECDRVVPVVEAIRQRFGNEVWLSIDTSAPVVINESVQVGADIWNDVRALKRAGALATAAKVDIPIVLMHMRGEPTTMGLQAKYNDVVPEVLSELRQSVDRAVIAGVKPENLIIDPGFGFAKNFEHHQILFNQLYRLHELGLPILLGVSRKRFLGEVLKNSGNDTLTRHTVSDRDAIGMAAALIAVQQGVSIIRTHNVTITAQGLALWQQIQS